MTVSDVVTEAYFALNDVVDAPEATVTPAGTVMALLLLAKATLRPLDGAAELSDTVQVVDPEPVNELLPHDRALIDGANGAADPLRLMEAVFEFVPWVAVNVTVCDAVTEVAVAEKIVVEAPDGTVTETGTETALLLLERSTSKPLEEAGAVNLTVQVSVPAPIIDVDEQERPESAAVEEDDADPLPCSFTVPVTLLVVLLFAFTVS